MNRQLDNEGAQVMMSSAEAMDLCESATNYGVDCEVARVRPRQTWVSDPISSASIIEIAEPVEAGR